MFVYLMQSTISIHSSFFSPHRKKNTDTNRFPLFYYENNFKEREDVDAESDPAPTPALRKLLFTCPCKLATVAGSCSKIRLLAPTAAKVSKY